MEKVTLIIDNEKVEVPKNYTVLEAARQVGIDIPTLCYLKGANEIGACRVCLVEVQGARALQAACVYPVSEGMVVKTNTKNLRSVRKSIVELILSNHNRECLSCARNKSCELQNLAEELNISNIPYDQIKKINTFDDKSHSIVRDASKCVLCGRCIGTCSDVQQIGILSFTNRGIRTEVSPAFDKSLVDTPCIFCGQCVVACPVAALREKEEIEKVWDAIDNPEIHVVAQTAPAVRAALGEEFGFPVGTRVTGKMVTALKKMGFDKVFDTNFAADLTILEEGNELLHRIQDGGKLPMITSCSPGWIRFAEFNYPELLDNLSTCKSPQQMMGAVIKSYYAEKHNLDPNKVFVVSIMPCVSKKQEAARPEMNVKGIRDVDAVLTTRELAKMIKQAGLDFINYEESDFDSALGEYTGAGVIFGTTGGVMEAALRTVADILENKDLEKIEYQPVRGFGRIKEAEVTLGGIPIRVAVAHGAAAAKEVMDSVKAGKKDYHFIEIMGCSGGCVTGGGQPYVTSKAKMACDVWAERAKALYEEDTVKTSRKSHQNSLVNKLYEEYLGKPNSHKAHELLHTHYFAREKFPVADKKKEEVEAAQKEVAAS